MPPRNPDAPKSAGGGGGGGGRRGGGGRARNKDTGVNGATANGTGAAAAGGVSHDHSDDEDLYHCIICTEPCTMFGVFECGHYFCAVCSLRSHTIGKQPCPVCRSASKRLVITDSKHPSDDDDTFEMAVFAQPFRPVGEPPAASSPDSGALVFNKRLNCYVDGERLAKRVSKLADYLCPMPECWTAGVQEAFREMSGLVKHLREDHQLRYCGTCLEHRPVFLCEQKVYNEAELDQHNRGKCKKDSPIFQGHPLCLYCSKRFYDGELLLKHMMKDHYTCDVCNSREFTFTFYKTREKLLEHFGREHKVCSHPDCSTLDPMERVFRSDVELQGHMQRVHGAASRTVDLASLGFRFGVSATIGGGGGSSSSGSSAAAMSTAPGISGNGVASAGSTHAVKIIFDHVSRREEVNMLPTKTKTDHEAVHHQPIPSHYEVEAVAPLRRPDAVAGDAQQQQQQQQRPESSAAANAAGSAKRGVSPQSNGAAGSSPSTSSAAAAAPVAATATPPPQEVLPSDPKELNAILKKRLLETLSGPQFDVFRAKSADFLNNKLLATEYYAVLSGFFAEREKLEYVFAPLIASMPNEMKREALLAAKKMLTSREAQKIEESRREEEAKARAAAAADRKKHAWRAKPGAAAPPVDFATAAPIVSPGGKRGGGGGGGGAAAASGAWGTRNAVTPPSASSGPSFTAISSPDVEDEHPLLSASSLPAAATTRALHSDPEAFPTLDRNPTRPPKGKKGSLSQWAAGAPAAGAPSKNTVWFKKNSAK